MSLPTGLPEFFGRFGYAVFCHTSAYPKPVDVKLHETLPDFITRRNGIALKPGDGIIHSG